MFFFVWYQHLNMFLVSHTFSILNLVLFTWSMDIKHMVLNDGKSDGFPLIWHDYTTSYFWQHLYVFIFVWFSMVESFFPSLGAFRIIDLFGRWCYKIFATLDGHHPIWWLLSTKISEALSLFLCIVLIYGTKFTNQAYLDLVSAWRITCLLFRVFIILWQIGLRKIVMISNI